MARSAVTALIFAPTSLRRNDWKRIGFSTWMRSMTQSDRRLPVDRLQDAARRRGGHHVIGDALDLHFRPRKTGAIAPHVQSARRNVIRLLP